MYLTMINFSQTRQMNLAVNPSLTFLGKASPQLLLIMSSVIRIRIPILVMKKIDLTVIQELPKGVAQMRV